MARRKRDTATPKINVGKGGVVVFSDKAIVNADAGGAATVSTNRRKRKRLAGRIYEFTPGWGRNAVRIGRGTVKKLSKAPVLPIAKTAVSEVE